MACIIRPGTINVKNKLIFYLICARLTFRLLCSLWKFFHVQISLPELGLIKNATDPYASIESEGDLPHQVACLIHTSLCGRGFNVYDASAISLADFLNLFRGRLDYLLPSSMYGECTM
jgi:hypothetical protein